MWDSNVLFETGAIIEYPLLATLDPNDGTINIVRWSKDGKFLSIGNDKHILVYQLSNQNVNSYAFGSSHAKNRENWVRKFMLQGHSMDIIDIDWEYGCNVNNMMQPIYTVASASIDNNVMVWEVTVSDSIIGMQTVTPKAILKGHASFVKGVSFDPIGRYLITMGADNQCLVWENQTSMFASKRSQLCNKSTDALNKLKIPMRETKTNQTFCSTNGDWVVVRQITAPFEKSPDKTLFRRGSWAPDGSCVCLCSSIKSTKPTACVLKRLSWSSVCDLVGHSAPSTCTRFCPLLIQASVPGGTPMSVVALGDQVGVLSLWGTESKSALIVVRDMFNGAAITDITWHCVSPSDVYCKNRKDFDVSGAYWLVASSIDGSICALQLTFDEIGKPSSLNVVNTHYEQLYGINFADLWKVQHKHPDGAHVDSIGFSYSKPVRSTNSNPFSALETLNGSAVSDLSAVGETCNLVIGPADLPKSYSQIRTQQITTKTKSGKKRIAPVLMQVAADASNDGSGPMGAGDTSAIPMALPGVDKKPRTDSAQAWSSLPVPVPNASVNNHSDMFDNVMSSNSTRCGHNASSHTASSTVNYVPVPILSIVTTKEQFTYSMPIHINAVKTPGAFNYRVPNMEKVVRGRYYNIELKSVLGDCGTLSTCVTCQLITKDPTADNDTCGAKSALLWFKNVVGSVTTIAGNSNMGEKNDESNSNGRDGALGQMEVLVLGCADGCVLVLDLNSGFHLHPTLVLGNAVAQIDLQNKNILICTVSGDVFHWVVSGAETRQWCMVAVVKTNCDPIVQSIRSKFSLEGVNGSRQKNGLNMAFKSCYLTQKGVSSFEIRMEATYCESSKAPTGNLDKCNDDTLHHFTFQYSNSCECWLRMQSLEVGHSLSCLNRLGSNYPLEGADIKSSLYCRTIANISLKMLKDSVECESTRQTSLTTDASNASTIAKKRFLPPVGVCVKVSGNNATAQDLYKLTVSYIEVLVPFKDMYC